MVNRPMQENCKVGRRTEFIPLPCLVSCNRSKRNKFGPTEGCPVEILQFSPRPNVGRSSYSGHSQRVVVAKVVKNFVFMAWFKAG